jgi:hypothetical protein
MLVLFLACFSTEQPLSRSELFTRISLDLRGLQPSLKELDAVQRSELHLNKKTDELIENERFGIQFARLMSGVWKTEVVELDHRLISDHDYSFPDAIPMITAMGEEPLQILAEIANQDLPYQEFVTGNWTMNNQYLARWAPVNYPEGETGWKKVTYTDNRPAAGVLASNGLWWRYNSTQANANRGIRMESWSMISPNGTLSLMVNPSKGMLGCLPFHRYPPGDLY